MIIVVALVIMGPKELPKVLRKVGYWAGRIRRYAAEMRVQSGIDEILRTEGLDRDILEIRKLARGEISGIAAAANPNTPYSDVPDSPYGAYTNAEPEVVVVERHREYPPEGADAYGALPETAVLYADALPNSNLAYDPTYTQGVPFPSDDEAKPEQESREASSALTHDGAAEVPRAGQ